MKKIAPAELLSKANDPDEHIESSTPRPQSAPTAELLASVGVADNVGPDARDFTGAAASTDSSGSVGQASKGEDAAHAVSPRTDENKFDPSRLRLNVNFGLLVGATKHVLTVPVRKPTRFEWVRCRSEEAWRIEVATLTWREDREAVYVVDPALWSVTPEIVPTLLIATTNTAGAVFLTPIRLPGPDGRHNEWHRTLLAGIQLAMQDRWVRFVANQGAGGYDVFSAPGDLGPPTWPALTFTQLLEIALRDRIIADHDHPILRRLRGEM